MNYSPRGRRRRLLAREYLTLLRNHGAPTKEEFIDTLIANTIPIYSHSDYQKAFRSLLAERVDAFFGTEVDGTRQFIPIEVGGERRWIPHGEATLDELKNYRDLITRPNLLSVDRAYRRQMIEIEILEQEAKFRAGLTAEDVQLLVDQALYWLQQV